MKYQLYQMTDQAPVALRFRAYDPDRPVRRAHYECTYVGEIGGDVTLAEADNTLFAMTALDCLFRKFNIDHPTDFEGYSLSVGDVVHLDGTRLYYCDPIGWTWIAGGWQ